jgi:NTP pyrophosphatase (non-canonical NTP hydrolase)
MLLRYDSRMTFDEYQQKALTTAITNPDPLMDKTIWVLGIVGEASEIAEKWKKLVAYREGKITEDDKTELGKEIGDVVWYLAVLADSLGLSFDQLMETNIAKLQSRKERNVLKGSGDNR